MERNHMNKEKDGDMVYTVNTWGYPCPVESSLGRMLRPVGKAPTWTNRTSACMVPVTMATRQGWSGGQFGLGKGGITEAGTSHIQNGSRQVPEPWRVTEN